MPGYIDSSSDRSLFESYAQGRAFAGAKLEGLSNFAQWSAVLDGATCDWCGWADSRIFDTTIEPYDPPMHWGCRCIIAYIKADEFMPEPDWGDGPPPEAWPPGRGGGAGPDGKPVLRSEGKRPKPKPWINEEKVSAAVDKYDERWSRGGLFKKDYSAHSAWHQESIREVLGSEFDKFHYDTFQKILEKWVEKSTPQLKELMGAIASRDLDAISRAARTVTRSAKFDPEKLLKIADANASIAGRVAQRIFGAESRTLYRGVRADAQWTKNIFAALKEGEPFAIKSNMIESWTSDTYTAIGFSGGYTTGDGIIFVKEVQTTDFFATFLENPAMISKGEREILWSNLEGKLVPKLDEVEFNKEGWGATVVPVW